MVFGAIINWTVGKTLDLTFDTIWWITKKTGQGIFNAGHYLIISKNKNTQFQIEKKEIESERETEKEVDIDPECKIEGIKERYEIIKLLKEQNKLLAEELRILQTSNHSEDEEKRKEEEKVKKD
jgi:hypothetical protein